MIALNKPYDMLSQFTDPEGRATLGDCVDVPGLYPAGRLDRDSEGLMLLTDDGPLQHRLSDPAHGLFKTYHAQVEGIPGRAALESLRRGIRLKDGPTRPAQVALLAGAPAYLWKREPPIRQRRKIATAWLEIRISEGRNRQVRRMTAAVDLPTLRLVRFAIGNLELADLAPGQWREVSPDAVLGAARP